MSVAHSERAHAKLSASGSSRWLKCTPSVQLEQGFPDQTSAFAEEGTLAHEISELYLGLHLDHFKKAAFTRRLNKKKKEEHFAEDMLDYIEAYVDIVIERINEAKSRSEDAIVLIEQRLDFSQWVPEGFGTGDVVIIADGILEIIDLKYGKGVPVSAEGNSQMRLYALGALNQFGFLYDIETVRMTIVQPRLDSVSTDEMEADKLLAWADETVKPRADLAMAGEGEFVAGEHCRFCKARSTCRARADKNMEIARFEFQEPPLLSNEEIGQILLEAEEIQKWAKDVQTYALAQAEHHNEKFPGWKLVEGRSNRKYADEQNVHTTLASEGFEEDVIAPRKLLGITAMEKSIGKKQFNSLLADLVIKPSGKPTLVQESDKRPEINSTDSAIEDFKELS
jgi:hypothetical protein